LTSVAQVTITVQAAPVASGTTIVPSVNPIVAGQGVTFTAAVSGSNPAGAVTFKDGVTVLCNAVPLVSGQAQCAAGALAVGSHGITAEYAGDAANSPSTSPAVTQVVSKAGTSVIIGAHTPNPSVSGARCRHRGGAAGAAARRPGRSCDRRQRAADHAARPAAISC
jgi:hypothetical protein